MNGASRADESPHACRLRRPALPHERDGPSPGGTTSRSSRRRLRRRFPVLPPRFIADARSSLLRHQEHDHGEGGWSRPPTPRL
jgi:hypothetical protein